MVTPAGLLVRYIKLVCPHHSSFALNSLFISVILRSRYHGRRIVSSAIWASSLVA